MRTVSLPATLAAALLAAGAARAQDAPGPAPTAPAAPAAEAPAEPPAAVVHGLPLPRRAFHEALARRFLRGEEGDKSLQHLLMDTAARREQERRGVTVTDEELAKGVEDARRSLSERMARAGQRVLPGQDPLEASLKEAGSSMEEFLAQARGILAIQKMASEDLGAHGTVPDAQVEIWLRDLLHRKGFTVDPAALKPGEAARIGDDPVTWEQAGRWLARTLRKSDRRETAVDLAFGIWVEDRAVRQGAALTVEEIEGEVARLRREFQRQPGIEGTGVSFEDWLHDTAGLTPAELRKDPGFRSRLLARKMAAADLAPERVREEWERNQARYGETARLRRLVVHGEDRASVFGASARPMAEARKLVDRALEEIRDGKAFDLVARRYSEDFPPDGPRGQPFDIMAPPPAKAGDAAPASGRSVVPQPVSDAVFRAKDGELLGPIRAADGWYLVLVEKRTPAPAFEQCAARVRDDLVAAAVNQWKVERRADPEVRIADDL